MKYFNRVMLLTTLIVASWTGWTTVWAADLLITGSISGTQTYDSPEGIVFDQSVINTGANITAISSYEVHLKPGTRIADGARLSVTVRDNDGLSNRWEMQYFGNLTQNPEDDPDGDGLTNLVEYQAGTTNPANPDTDADGVLDDCEAPYDAIPPTITLLGANPVSLCIGAAYNDAGATANDNCLGTISQDITIANPVNTNVRGTYQVTYNVQDGAGNTATQVTRTVYVDIIAPVITMTGENPYVLCIGSTFEDPGASATDNCSGDLSQSIVVNNPVNTNQPGNYLVTYNVADSAGNNALSVTRTVVVMGGDQTIQINTTYQYDDIGRLRSINRVVQ